MTMLTILEERAQSQMDWMVVFRQKFLRKDALVLQIHDSFKIRLFKCKELGYIGKYYKNYVMKKHDRPVREAKKQST